MLILGITGGVATGKSTVTGMFASLGAPTLSADAVAHDLLAPGTDTTRAVLAAFPDCALPGQQSTAIDRRALGRRVFADPAARRRLEALTHPPVIAILESRIAEWRPLPGVAGAAEIPLLFEVGLDRLCDRIIVVACAEALQLSRLAQRLGGDMADAQKMLSAQWPLAAKAARAHHVIRTDDGLEDTRRQVQNLWKGLMS